MFSAGPVHDGSSILPSCGVCRLQSATIVVEPSQADNTHDANNNGLSGILIKRLENPAHAQNQSCKHEKQQQQIQHTTQYSEHRHSMLFQVNDLHR